jgi:RNA polymerase sigma-70 factor (ECF subfamily)
MTGGRLIQSPARCAVVVVLYAPAPVASDAVEAELLALVASGDTGEPLRRLYDRYERRLYGLGIHLLRERGLAEELVQETWMRVWRSASRFDPERGTVRTFIFTIARRVAVDLWRRPSSRALHPELADAGAVEARADEVLLAVTVRDAMTSLSPAHREVLELVYDEDLKLAEVAQRLSIALGTVKTRAHHALRAMRRALEERGWDG